MAPSHGGAAGERLDRTQVGGAGRAFLSPHCWPRFVSLPVVWGGDGPLIRSVRCFGLGWERRCPPVGAPLRGGGSPFLVVVEPWWMPLSVIVDDPTLGRGVPSLPGVATVPDARGQGVQPWSRWARRRGSGIALFSRDLPRVSGVPVTPSRHLAGQGRMAMPLENPLGKDSSASILPFLCQGCRASPQPGGSLRMGTGDGSAAWPCPKSRGPHLQAGSTGIPGSLYSCPAPGASAAIPGDPVSGLGPCGCSWSPAEGRGFGRLAWVKGFPVPGKMPSRNSWWLHLAEWEKLLLTWSFLLSLNKEQAVCVQ